MKELTTPEALKLAQVWLERGEIHAQDGGGQGCFIAAQAYATYALASQMWFKEIDVRVSS